MRGLVFVSHFLRPDRKRGVGLGGVGDHHLVTAGCVLEEIEKTFLFHQPTGEMEIGLPVLNAVLSGIERTLNLKDNIEPFQDLLQDVRHRQLLKDARLSPFRQQPKRRNDFQLVVGKRGVAFALRNARADTVVVADFLAGNFDFNGDRITNEFLERNGLGPFGLGIDGKTVRFGNGVAASKPDGKQGIRRERRGHADQPVGLCGACHKLQDVSGSRVGCILTRSRTAASSGRLGLSD